VETSKNKAAFGGFGGQAWSCSSFSLARRGDEERGELLASEVGPLHLQQGSGFTSRRRFITASFSSSFFSAERRPLQSQAMATVTSGCRLQDFINLQAFKPFRRPSGFAVVGFHLPAPSGVVPGGVEIDYDKPYCGGEEAGLDCVFCFSSKVLCAICMGRFVFSSFSEALSVNCTSTAMNE
jgi:hypothetical protein